MISSIPLNRFEGQFTGSETPILEFELDEREGASQITFNLLERTLGGNQWENTFFRIEILPADQDRIVFDTGVLSTLEEEDGIEETYENAYFKITPMSDRDFDPETSNSHKVEITLDNNEINLESARIRIKPLSNIDGKIGTAGDDVTFEITDAKLTTREQFGNLTSQVVPDLGQGKLVHTFADNVHGWKSSNGEQVALAEGEEYTNYLEPKDFFQNSFSVSSDKDIFLEIDIKEALPLNGALTIEVNGHKIPVFEFNKVLDGKTEDMAAASASVEVNGKTAHWRKLESNEEIGLGLFEFQDHTIQVYIPNEFVEDGKLDLKIGADENIVFSLDKVELSHTTVSEAKDATFFVNDDTATEIAGAFEKFEPISRMGGDDLIGAADSIRQFSEDKLAELIIDLSGNLGARNLSQLELGDISDKNDKTTLVGIAQSAIEGFKNWDETFSNWTADIWQRLKNQDDLDDAAEAIKGAEVFSIVASSLTTVGSLFSFAHAVKSGTNSGFFSTDVNFKNLGWVAASLWFVGNATNLGKTVFESQSDPDIPTPSEADLGLGLLGKASLETSVGNLIAELKRRGVDDLAEQLNDAMVSGVQSYMDSAQSLLVSTALITAESDPRGNTFENIEHLKNYGFEIEVEDRQVNINSGGQSSLFTQYDAVLKPINDHSGLKEITLGYVDRPNDNFDNLLQDYEVELA